jgi:hypothetical protein
MVLVLSFIAHFPSCWAKDGCHFRRDFRKFFISLKKLLSQYIFNHGYEPQSKLWKHFAASYRDIIPMLMQDSSIYKFQRTLFLKLGSYYPPLRGIIRLTLPIVSESHYNLPIPICL